MNWKIELARILKNLNAFKGSRPLLDTPTLLMVKSICRDEINEDIKSYLTKKLKELNYEIVDDIDEIEEFVEGIHNVLRGEDTYLDFLGFEKVKEGFLNIGCECDYVIGKKGNLMVGLTLYYDKIRKNPKFIEAVALLKEIE
ncbi:DUF2120 family protein [Methanocaldococcus indicus]|uniref:DUF2120 family protein n=1 Tax=Methanocaldococcus indicus TaxID=213231 RepID=UPI003C6CE081